MNHAPPDSQKREERAVETFEGHYATEERRILEAMERGEWQAGN